MFISQVRLSIHSYWRMQREEVGPSYGVGANNGRSSGDESKSGSELISHSDNGVILYHLYGIITSIISSTFPMLEVPTNR
jgi:hypothetical protein